MRITGGVHRSRALKAPRGSSTRPTSDRVREALFSMLASSRDLDGAHVLDLYAGTGALGLEALSRGAATATWVERGREALDALEGNVASLGLAAQSRVLKTTVERAATHGAFDAKFDLVFVDPPYADVTSGALARSLAPWLEGGAPLFADDVTLVLEHSSRDTPPELSPLALVTSRKYGDSTLSVYVRQGRIT